MTRLDCSEAHADLGFRSLLMPEDTITLDVAYKIMLSMSLIP